MALLFDWFQDEAIGKILDNPPQEEFRGHDYLGSGPSVRKRNQGPRFGQEPTEATNR